MGYFCSQKCNLVQARAICKYEIITEIYATEGIRWCCFHLRNMSGGVENNNSMMELWLLLECSQRRDSSGYHRGERKHYSQQSPSSPRNSPPQKWTEKKIVVNYFSLYMYSLYSMQTYIMPECQEMALCKSSSNDPVNFEQVMILLKNVARSWAARQQTAARDVTTSQTQCPVELHTNLRDEWSFTITEEASTRALRVCANQPAHPLRPLPQRPNFISTYCRGPLRYCKTSYQSSRRFVCSSSGAAPDQIPSLGDD